MNPMALMQCAIDPESHLLVGIEDDPDGGIRVYLDARYERTHTHIGPQHPDEIRKARAAWAGSGDTVITNIPDAALCRDCDFDPNPESQS
jgi:hypothetical protein